MERREDRTSILSLEREPLRIGGDVQGAEARTEGEQRRRKPAETDRSDARKSAALMPTSATTVTGRLPTRSSSQPASGIDSSAPSDIANSASPSSELARPV